jgi:hypothetical protein
LAASSVVLTDREWSMVSLSAPLEPMVKDIEFARLAAGDCTDAAFRARCVGTFKGGPTTHRVTLDAEGQLVLKPDNQPTYRLAPQDGRRFRIVELEGFVVEFRGEGATLDEVIFHQPNGTFAARRLEAKSNTLLVVLHSGGNSCLWRCVRLVRSGSDSAFRTVEVTCRSTSKNGSGSRSA